MSAAWPVRLTDGPVTVRPLSTADADAWRSARQRNAAWLVPWDATVPPGGEARPRATRGRWTVSTVDPGARAHPACIPG